MSVVCNIRGVPISFPFEPYDLQKEYMDKVLQCLQNNQNGVLESPTGTGKTLSLLCSSLAWLTVQKAHFQEQLAKESYNVGDHLFSELDSVVQKAGVSGGRVGTNKESFFGAPKIIYSSRTHSQLSQAMQELKRTAYANVSATILGGREQLCIHPVISKETNNAVKTTMCNFKVKSRSCQFYNRTEKVKDDPKLKNIMDIEDLVLEGNKQKFCPFYMARELHKKADIIFMPYNYLLDAKIRKNFGIFLGNCVVILDEAHNIEHICEESVSIQIKNADITLCIDEVTTVMKALADINESSSLGALALDTLSSFKPGDLCLLKEILLKFETVFDNIDIKDHKNGVTFPGDYIYEVVADAGINQENKGFVINLMDNIIQFLPTYNEGPMQRSGKGLSILLDLLQLIFAVAGQQYMEKIRKCFKVHMNQMNNGDRKSNWLSKHQKNNSSERVLSFWCFSPGFGMNMLANENVKCLILTSGTLAPLNALISELELQIDVRLENPHIVKSDQVCVKILTKGPDLQLLNSSFQNRNNPAYIASLGRSIQNICRVLPGGLLIFFPSYTVMGVCQTAWQNCNLWAAITTIKPIFVEPRDKDEFRRSMKCFYERVNDPNYGGAIFMGVCRGKVSEGLDFADANGRGVIITGLPYPPFMDPRVVLKKVYLDECKKGDQQYLSGQAWYNIEACRAINQAIGRVIRHRNDYGMILLLDQRFTMPSIKNNMSKWLQNRIEVVENFGPLIASTKKFFVEASKNYPLNKLEPAVNISPSTVKTFTFNSSDSNTIAASSVQSTHVRKRRKIVIQANVAQKNSTLTDDAKDFISMLRNILINDDFIKMVDAITEYRHEGNIEALIVHVQNIFMQKHHLRYVLQGIMPYLRKDDKDTFNIFWEKFK